MTEQEARLEALKLAQQSCQGWSAESVVMTAKIYAAFILGDRVVLQPNAVVVSGSIGPGWRDGLTAAEAARLGP